MRREKGDYQNEKITFKTELQSWPIDISTKAPHFKEIFVGLSFKRLLKVLAKQDNKGIFANVSHFVDQFLGIKLEPMI